MSHLQQNVQERNVGVVRERTFVPKGTGKISKPQMPPRTKETPPNITNPRRPHQANQLQRHLIQKNYPRLQKCDRILIRLYVISDPSNVIYKQSYSDINGTLSVVWQQLGKKLALKLTNWSTTTAQADTTEWTILQNLKPNFNHSN